VAVTAAIRLVDPDTQLCVSRPSQIAPALVELLDRHSEPSARLRGHPPSWSGLEMQATGRCNASVRHSAYLHQPAAAVFGAAASGTKRPRQWPVDSKAVIRVAAGAEQDIRASKQHVMRIQQQELRGASDDGKRSGRALPAAPVRNCKRRPSAASTLKGGRGGTTPPSAGFESLGLPRQVVRAPGGRCRRWPIIPIRSFS
jgi:hypothetical protein